MQGTQDGQCVEIHIIIPNESSTLPTTISEAASSRLSRLIPPPLASHLPSRSLPFDPKLFFDKPRRHMFVDRTLFESNISKSAIIPREDMPQEFKRKERIPSTFAKPLVKAEIPLSPNELPERSNDVSGNALFKRSESEIALIPESPFAPAEVQTIDERHLLVYEYESSAY